jgi:hypothetical protein
MARSLARGHAGTIATSPSLSLTKVGEEAEKEICLGRGGFKSPSQRLNNTYILSRLNNTYIIHKYSLQSSTKICHNLLSDYDIQHLHLASMCATSMPAPAWQRAASVLDSIRVSTLQSCQHRCVGPGVHCAPTLPYRMQPRANAPLAASSAQTPAQGISYKRHRDRHICCCSTPGLRGRHHIAHPQPATLRRSPHPLGPLSNVLYLCSPSFLIFGSATVLRVRGGESVEPCT